MMEKWRDVPGYPEYRVSDRGRVKGKRGQVLKERKKQGYIYAILYFIGKPKSFRVHRLVLMAFRGMPKPGQESRHLDGNRANNRLDNLSWGTRKENMEDRARHGGNGKNRGEVNGQSKLEESQVRKIRAMWATGKYTQKRIGGMFGVNYRTISHIVQGDSWGWLS